MNKKLSDIRHVIKEIEEEAVIPIKVIPQEERDRSAHREVFLGCGECMDQMI